MCSRFIDDLVSVIIPVYNAQAFIKETINSVLLQSYNNIEIVLVDDCSTDQSPEIIKDLCKEYQNIIYFKQPQNLGAGAARNKALDLAKGQYVAFLDSDDLWEKEKIFKQIRLMKENPSCGFTYTGAIVVDENGTSLNKKRKVKEKFTYKKLLRNTMIITSSVVIDRKKHGDFKMSEIRSGQDYATWLILLKNEKIALGINESLCRYRITTNSLSSNKFKSIKQVYNIQRKQEKINFISASFNTCCFIFHAFIKHFL